MESIAQQVDLEHSSHDTTTGIETLANKLDIQNSILQAILEELRKSPRNSQATARLADLAESGDGLGGSGDDMVERIELLTDISWGSNQRYVVAVFLRSVREANHCASTIPLGAVCHGDCVLR